MIREHLLQRDASAMSSGFVKSDTHGAAEHSHSTHDDERHACGGCSDAAPCNACGAQVSDAVHQRYAWSELVARSRPGLSEFWRATIAGAAFHEPGPIRSAMLAHGSVASIRAQMLAIGGPPLRRLVPDPLLPRLELLLGGKCCPEPNYPSKGPEPVSGPVGDAIYVGEEYETEIVYRKSAVPDETGRKCMCECCRFFQVVLFHTVSVNRKPVANSKPYPRFDCSWDLVDSNGKVVGSAPATAGGEADKPDVGPGLTPRWVCHGDNPTPFKSEREFRESGVAEGLVEGPDSCKYFMIDQPGYGADDNTTVSQKFGAMGFVLDKCRLSLKFIGFVFFSHTMTISDGVATPVAEHGR